MDSTAKIEDNRLHNSMDTPYEDLRHAIESVAFAQRKNGDVIIESEHTGRYGEWLFDFRALMLQPKWLDRYAEIFWEQYGDRLPFQVGAMETAAISLVSAIVMKGVERGTPVNGFYIRKSRKRQGLMRQIEGTLTEDPIILVDDLINTGSTFEKQLAVLADTGRKVRSIFTMLAFRADTAYKKFEDAGITVNHLFTLRDFGIPLVQTASADVRPAFEELWCYSGPNPSFHLVVQKAAPVIDDTFVYFGCDDGTVRALEQKTGTIIWEFKVGKHPEGKGILSTPALYQGVLYFGAYDGVVYALDAKTGKKKWAYDDADWVGSSPSLAPELGLIYIGLEFGLFGKRGGVVALDMQTGRRRWQQKHKALTHGSPLYIREENLVVIGSNDGVCYAYDAKTGELQWHYATQGDIKVSPAYDPKKRIIFVPSMDGKLYALSARKGEPFFAFETGAAIYSIPLVQGDTVYVASLDKSLYAIDIIAGKCRWAFETSGRIFGAPVIFGDSIYIGSNDGRLYEIDMMRGISRGYFQASERIMSRVAINPQTKHIFARTVANELYCLHRVDTHDTPNQVQ